MFYPKTQSLLWGFATSKGLGQFELFRVFLLLLFCSVFYFYFFTIKLDLKMGNSNFWRKGSTLLCLWAELFTSECAMQKNPLYKDRPCYPWHLLGTSLNLDGEVRSYFKYILGRAKMFRIWQHFTSDNLVLELHTVSLVVTAFSVRAVRWIKIFAPLPTFLSLAKSLICCKHPGTGSKELLGPLSPLYSHLYKMSVERYR